MADSAPQRRDYKVIKELDITKVDWTKYECVYGQVINSAFTHPANGSEVSLSQGADTVGITGWAHGNGETGNQVVRV